MAKQDGSDNSDITRFKVQELHMINSFSNYLNKIEYNASSKIRIPKTIKNENLVELNLNAFQENYEVDKE
jgi:hypothetical protein